MDLRTFYIIKCTYGSDMQYVSYAGFEQIVDEYDNEMVVPHIFESVEEAERKINYKGWRKEGEKLEIIEALIHFDDGRTFLRELGEPDDWGR